MNSSDNVLTDNVLTFLKHSWGAFQAGFGRWEQRSECGACSRQRCWMASRQLRQHWTFFHLHKLQQSVSEEAAPGCCDRKEMYSVNAGLSCGTARCCIWRKLISKCLRCMSKDQDWCAPKHRKLIKLKLQQDICLLPCPLLKSSHTSAGFYDCFPSPTRQWWNSTGMPEMRFKNEKWVEFGVMFTYTGTISPRQFIPAARQEPWNKASELIRLPHLIRHPQQRGLSGNAVMDSAGSTSARAPLTAGGKSDLGVSQQHLCQAEGHNRKKQWTWEKTFMRDLYTDPLP